MDGPVFGGTGKPQEEGEPVLEREDLTALRQNGFEISRCIVSR